MPTVRGRRRRVRPRARNRHAPPLNIPTPLTPLRLRGSPPFGRNVPLDWRPGTPDASNNVNCKLYGESGEISKARASALRGGPERPRPHEQRRTRAGDESERLVETMIANDDIPAIIVNPSTPIAVSYTHLRAHETDSYLV